MKIIKITSSIIVLLCFTTQAQSLTLTDTLINTYQNSTDLAAKREQLKAIDEKIFEANSGFLPQVIFRSAYQNNKNKVNAPYGESNSDKWVKSRSKSDTFSIQQNLFASGGTLLAIEKAKYIINQGRADLEITEAQVFMDAISAHFEVVFSKKVLEASKKSEASIKKTLQVTKEKFEAGIGTRTNVAMAQQSYANSVRGLIEAEGKYSTALSAFARITGKDGISVSEYEEAHPPAATLEQALDTAYLKNGNFIAAKNQFYAADTEIKEVVAQMMPSLDLSLESSRQTGRNLGSTLNDKITRNNTLAFQLTVPIYKSGREYSAIRKARSSASASKISLNGIADKIKEAVSKSWYSYMTAKASVAATEAAVTASNIAVDGAQQEYDEGVMAITDLLDVQLKKLQSEISLFDAQRNLVVASYSVKSLMGELSAIELKLPMKYYDVEKNYNKIKFKLM